jgi:hypothetical protein
VSIFIVGGRWERNGYWEGDGRNRVSERNNSNKLWVTKFKALKGGVFQERRDGRARRKESTRKT